MYSTIYHRRMLNSLYSIHSLSLLLFGIFYKCACVRAYVWVRAWAHFVHINPTKQTKHRIHLLLSPCALISCCFYHRHIFLVPMLLFLFYLFFFLHFFVAQFTALTTFSLLLLEMLFSYKFSILSIFLFILHRLNKNWLLEMRCVYIKFHGGLKMNGFLRKKKKT